MHECEPHDEIAASLRAVVSESTAAGSFDVALDILMVYQVEATERIVALLKNQNAITGSSGRLNYGP